jgi:anti-sigma regulatory factor (Ser/Thr protein kinase)
MDPLSSQRACLSIAEPEDVGAIRRHVRAWAVRSGASELQCARAELAATELGTNVLRHAGARGYMLVQPLVGVERRGLELVAVDHGPGLRDVSGLWRTMLDQDAAPLAPAPERGQGLGCGLGAVRRSACEFDLHSTTRGTVVLARFLFERETRAPVLRCGAVSVPIQGEEVCGDGCGVVARGESFAALVVDGLGHGPAAAIAAQAALAVLHEATDLDPVRYLLGAHAALRGTRGAALSVCRIDPAEGRLSFAGLGNVEGRVHTSSRSFGMSPRPGTAGMNVSVPRIHVQELPWEPGAMLVLHSDGVRHQAELGALRARDPSIIAAVLQRDWSRGRDDATVLVVHDTREPVP